MAKGSKSSTPSASGITKRKLQSNILKQIKQYEKAAHRKVTAVSFPTGSRRIVMIDTVPTPD